MRYEENEKYWGLKVNTDIYTYDNFFESNEPRVTHARSLGEETELIEVGFDCMSYNEKDGVAI